MTQFDGIKIICNTIERNEFSDFENCLQVECATEISAHFIVTKNVDDFRHTHIKAVIPQELLEIIQE